MSVACASHSTDVKIPEKPVPKAFGLQPASGSVAPVRWRDFFVDEQLNALIQATLGANPDLHIALQRIELARAGVRDATGALLPRVNLAAGVGVQKYGRYTVEGAGNASTDITPGRPAPTHVGDFAIGLQSTWEVDVWGKLRNERRAAVARYLATVEGANFVITGLISDVAIAYFELLALDHTRDVLAQTVVRQQEALDVVRLQMLAGRANELAVQQFAAQLAGTKVLAAETELRIREVESRVNLLRGAYPQPIVRSKEALLRDVPPTLASGLPAQLLINRPDVREAELEVLAAKCDLQAARAAFLPSLSLSAGVGYQAFNPRFLFTTPESLVYSATAGLVAPLVNRSGIEAQFDSAKAFQIQAMYGYQKVVLTAFTEVVNALSRLKGSSRIAALRRERKSAVEQAVDTADALYRAGKASYFEVLIAQQSALSAELELIDSRRDQHLARIAVYKALGGGWH
jgi:NodT family efflux transporter outer membrane factor (OMF) lipoprotein